MYTYRRLMSSFAALAVMMVSGVVLLTVSGCGKGKDSLMVKGSDTIVNLSQAQAETYMEKNKDVSIAVTGGGSGTGIAAFLNKKVDIANSSRAMGESEIKKAEQTGLDPMQIAIGLDGLAVVVHPDNDLESLTIDQIGKIFRGEITNFKDVGGPDAEISLYGRQSNSGTFDYFRKNVLGGKNYSKNMRRMNGNAGIVDSVSEDQNGIGYVGVGYITGEKMGEVTADVSVVNVATGSDQPAKSPLNSEAVTNGTYPLARPLYEIVARKTYKQNKAVRKYLHFVLSPEGQEICSEVGYFPISDKYRKHNKSEGVKYDMKKPE